MNKNSTSQTKSLGFFKIKRIIKQVNKKAEVRDALKPKMKILSSKLDINETILDSLLKDRIIYGKHDNTNTWLREPLVDKEPVFSVRNGCLMTQADSKFALFKKFACEKNQQNIVSSLENAVCRVILNKSDYFDIFNKYKHNRRLEFCESVAVFVVWLSRYLKYKVTAFVFDFLSVYVYCLYSQCVDSESIVELLTKPKTKAKCYGDLASAEKLYYEIYGSSRFAYMDLNVLVEYLVDYCVENKIFDQEETSLSS